MEQTTVKKKTTRKVVIMIASALALAFTGLGFFLSGDKFESTDNAQIDGDIVSIKTSIAGYVSRVTFSDNQEVKKGDTLIEFDPLELKAKVMQAEAALESAYANLRVTQNRARASGENAHASQLSTESNQESIVLAKTKMDKAQKDLDRVTQLIKAKASTQEQLDNAQANFLVAQSEYNKTISQEKSSVSTSNGLEAQASADQNQIDLALTQIKQREAELVLARKQLSYAYVIAPNNGIATKRNINPGQYVTAGQSLCAIVNTDCYWVTANFKESQLKQIRTGQEVDIVLDSYPDLKLKGEVASFGGATGARFSLLPPDNATGNFIKITQRFPIRITIRKFPKNVKEIFPGLSAVVKIKIS